MNKRIVWLIVNGLMALSLLLAACAPAATPTASNAPATPSATPTPTAPSAATTPVAKPTQKESTAPTADVPKYGGTLNLYSAGPTDWEWNHTTSWGMMYDPLWGGNWAKGPAGGYGSKESDYTNNYDIYDHYEGWAAEKWSWTIDAKTNKATIVYQIRPGVHYHVIPGNEASALVNGREMTADDVVYTLRWQYSAPRMYGYSYIPELRNATYEKTGPWEVTVYLDSAEQIMPAMDNIGGKRWPIRPPEIDKKYGTFNKWQYQIGTGPFILIDYVPGSQGTVIRNPNYWAKDPVGPGKGNQLPYIDRIKLLDIPDLSTRYAALRTGKIDTMFPLDLEAAADMRRTAPGIKELQYYAWTSSPGAVYMRIDIQPTSDIRVRRALMMATDFESIKQSVNKGQGEIITFPHMPSVAYGGASNSPIKGLYIGLNDPELPADVKELYSYKPEKAKQLLKEAGYPSGFKVQVVTVSANVDYLSILKDMWAKVGVQLEIVIRDSGQIVALVNKGEHPPLSVSNTNAVGRFYQPTVLTGVGDSNRSMIRQDPTIEAALSKMRALALTDIYGAMKIMRDVTRDYILAQAYAIPTPMAQSTVFWWPWLRGYSGETTVQLSIYNRWAEWVWIDEAMKKTMGY